jgi:superoxide dismutase, Cu-Zn family
MTVLMQGFQPNSVHGFHLHQFGDISSPTGEAVGGHFNPFNAPHSCPRNNANTDNNPQSRHAGDFGNLQVDAQGMIRIQIASSLISLYAGVVNSVIGRALSFHEGIDDCVTNPAGNSGKRIAQGVIGLRNSTLPFGLAR